MYQGDTLTPQVIQILMYFGVKVCKSLKTKGKMARQMVQIPLPAPTIG